MAAFSRVTALLIMAVFITYYCGTEAKIMVSVGMPGTDERMNFDSPEVFDKWVELGVNMFKKTYDSICWYEELKQYPFNNRTGDFISCYDEFVAMASKSRYRCMKVFSRSLNITGRHSIPDYHSKCEDLVLTPRAIPKENEGSVLNDGEDEYAFKAYFHCLIHQVREKLGDKVIQIIKTERIDSKRDLNDWMETVNDRVNEFRARHGVGALQLNKTISNDAQKRADTLAKACSSSFGKITEEDLIESICLFSSDFRDFSIRAFECVNLWYKLGKNYPFQKQTPKVSLAFKRSNKLFVNLLWKGSTSVGYGYAFNPSCRTPAKGFFVAQFHPVGRKDEEYAENVLPPSS